MPQSSLLEVESKVEVAETLVRTPSTTNTTTDMSQELGVSPYGLFSKFPSEIRTSVWNGVLVSKKGVIDAFKFMSPQQPLMVATCIPINDIDAALLRTSRAIYEEAFPILYSENRFIFEAPSQITTFAFGELCKYSGRSSLNGPLGPSFERYVRVWQCDLSCWVPKFESQDAFLSKSVSCTPWTCPLTPLVAFEEAVLTATSAQGRLSIVRSVTLHLTNLSNVYVGTHQRGLKAREQEAIWSSWAEFFQPSPGQQSLTFPMLKELCLDFCHWGLDDSDASKLRIAPILRKLRPSGGLQRLWIAGVIHEQNLNDLKHGFLKNGGRFVVLENDNTIIAEGMISYNDLHTVSKGVRDILQKDGVSAMKLV